MLQIFLEKVFYATQASDKAEGCKNEGAFYQSKKTPSSASDYLIACKFNIT